MKKEQVTNFFAKKKKETTTNHLGKNYQRIAFV